MYHDIFSCDKETKYILAKLNEYPFDWNCVFRAREGKVSIQNIVPLNKCHQQTARVWNITLAVCISIDIDISLQMKWYNQPNVIIGFILKY